EAKYANGALVELPYPTNDVRLMTRAATEAVNRLFRPGFKYSNRDQYTLGQRDFTIWERSLQSGMGYASRADESELYNQARSVVGGEKPVGAL
ncbi:DNA-directed DNA polymerase, partial [Pseudomonas syringae pv. actinidiae ICMP 19101]